MLYVRRSEAKVTMLANNNGFQLLPEEFNGDLIGNEFTVTPQPPNATLGVDTLKCPDSSILPLSGAPIEVVGQFTEDGLELMATMRERFRQGPTSDVVLTSTWKATRKR